MLTDGTKIGPTYQVLITAKLFTQLVFLFIWLWTTTLEWLILKLEADRSF